MGIFNNLLNTEKTTTSEQQQEYDKLVKDWKKKKKRIRELIKLVSLYEEKLRHYMSDGYYEQFLLQIELEHGIRFPKQQKGFLQERQELKAHQKLEQNEKSTQRQQEEVAKEQLKFTIAELKQRAIEKRKEREETVPTKERKQSIGRAR